MLKRTHKVTMALLTVAFAAAVLPVSPVAAATSGSVTATATVRQRVALTLTSSAVSDPGSALKAANVDSNLTSEWVDGVSGKTLLITVVPNP